MSKRGWFTLFVLIGLGTSFSTANTLKTSPPADCVEGDKRGICFEGNGGNDDSIGGSHDSGSAGVSGGTSSGGSSDANDEPGNGNADTTGNGFSTAVDGGGT